MAKIIRYAGNVAAFASQSQVNERTVFGDPLTQADDLTSQISTQYLRGWGYLAATDYPSREDFNAAFYTSMQFVSYLHQAGVPEWDAAQEYHTDSVVTRSGTVYISLTNTNTGNDPASDAVNWAEASGGGGIAWSFPTVNFTAEAGNGYLVSSTTVTAITLPAAPDAGDEIVISDLDQSWATASITVAGNGNNIEGDPNLTLNIAGANVSLVYSGTQWETANIGGGVQGPYQIVEDQFGAGIGPFTLSTAAASEEAILVVADGVVQPTSAYTVSGDQLTLTSAAASYVHVRNIGVPLNIGTPGDGTVTEAKLSNGVVPLGVSQTWQDVLVSRSASVVYTNTTGRPIKVAITAKANALANPAIVNFNVNGVRMASFSLDETSAGTIARGTVSEIIPDGDTYEVTIGSNTILDTWFELR